jgi:hypothetical protein
MIHSRYPRNTDYAVLAAQRGAALAKTIAAVGVLGGVLAIAVLASRDIQRPAEGRTRGDTTVPATVRFAVHVSPEAGVDDSSATEGSPKGSTATRQASNRQRASRVW